jgi:hypothetical protein
MVNTFFTEIGTNFSNMAKSLDKQRRFKQAVEAKEILLIIQRKKSNLSNGKTIGFKNHPIVLMWEEYEECLKAYFNAFYEQLCIDGFKMKKLEKMNVESEYPIPWFLYYRPLIYSHQARLLQKDPIYYKDKFKFPELYLSIGYIWIRPEKSILYYIENRECPEKISDPLDEKYKFAKYCQANIQSGLKKGELCNRLISVSQNDFCGVHTKKRKLE